MDLRRGAGGPRATAVAKAAGVSSSWYALPPAVGTCVVADGHDAVNASYSITKPFVLTQLTSFHVPPEEYMPRQLSPAPALLGSPAAKLVYAATRGWASSGPASHAKDCVVRLLG